MSKVFDASRREFLKQAGRAGACAAGAMFLGRELIGLDGSKAMGATGQPNILLLMTDEERDWFWLPKNFDFATHFPARQWLRDSGVRFTNYHVHTAPCSPSRSTIFTGRHTDSTQVFDNVIVGYQPDMNVALPTLGDMLKALGYQTAYRGKWHLFAQGLSLAPYGFDDWEAGDYDDIKGSEGMALDADIAEGASTYIRAQAGGTAPWFMTVSFVNPHDIASFPTYYDQGCARTNPEDLPDYEPLLTLADVPANCIDDLSKKPNAQSYWKTFYNSFKGEVSNTKENWLRMLNHYLYYLKKVDEHVMTVLDALAESGQMENTVILFTSDHGELGGAHTLRAKGPEVYAESKRVPLVVVDPRLPAQLQGMETKAFAAAIDLAPTILSLAGAPPPPAELDLRGVDLNVKVLQTADPSALPETVARDAILFTFDSRQGAPISRGGLVTVGRGYNRGILGYNSDGKLMKYARYFEKGNADGAPQKGHEELYDYAVDGSGETVNRAYGSPSTYYKNACTTMNSKLNALILKEMRLNNASGSAARPTKVPSIGCQGG